MNVTRTLSLADGPCLQAIRAYAGALERRTPLKLTIVEEEAAIAFEGDVLRTVRLRWELPEPKPRQPADDWEQRDLQDGPPPASSCLLIDHYARTLAAMAKEPGAAVALLACLES